MIFSVFGQITGLAKHTRSRIFDLQVIIVAISGIEIGTLAADQD